MNDHQLHSSNSSHHSLHSLHSNEFEQKKEEGLENSRILAGLLSEVPKKTNHLSSFLPKSSSSLAVSDLLSGPLSLAEEERLANELVTGLLEKEKERDARYALPAHLEAIKKLLDPPSRVKKKLPVISQLTPAMKERLAALPKPNDVELGEARALEKLSQKLGSTAAYEEINKRRPTSQLDPLAARGRRRLDLLFEEGEAEKNLPPLPTKPVMIPSSSASSTLPILALPGDSTALFKQAEKRKETSERHRAILRHLLGPEEDDENLLDDGDRLKAPANTLHSLASVSADKNLHNLRERKAGVKQPVSISFSVTTPLPLVSPLPLPGQATKNSLLEKEKDKRYLNAFSAKVHDELGVDLDKEYNRLRKYRQALRSIFLGVYLMRLTAGLNYWKAITAMLRLQRMKAALRIITRALRWNSYLKRKERRKHYQQLQKLNEAERALQNRLYLRRNAGVIFRALFRFWKMKKIKFSLNRRRSTVAIQKGIRGFMARRKVQKKIAFLNLLKKNATVIQTKYRGHLAKRKVWYFSIPPFSSYNHT